MSSRVEILLKWNFKWETKQLRHFPVRKSSKIVFRGEHKFPGLSFSVKLKKLTSLSFLHYRAELDEEFSLSLISKNFFLLISANNFPIEFHNGNNNKGAIYLEKENGKIKRVFLSTRRLLLLFCVRAINKITALKTH